MAKKTKKRKQRKTGTPQHPKKNKNTKLKITLSKTEKINRSRGTVGFRRVGRPRASTDSRHLMRKSKFSTKLGRLPSPTQYAGRWNRWVGWGVTLDCGREARWGRGSEGRAVWKIIVQGLISKDFWSGRHMSRRYHFRAHVSRATRTFQMALQFPNLDF